MNARKHARLRAHQLKRKMQRHIDALLRHMWKRNEPAMIEHCNRMLLLGYSSYRIRPDGNVELFK